VTDAETWGLLRSRARTIWLKATPKDHWERVVAQGDVRPMRGRPRAMNELRQLLAARKALYAEADVTLDTSSSSLGTVAERIASLVPN
jgi:XRE family aerobic/anaerobic benzoate catabolism transcriptional regulator